MPTSIKMGKIMAAAMPFFRSPENRSAANPTTVGPDAQPRSPARAISAYIAVPPPGSVAAAMEKVPGQKIPTENPQMAQPRSPSTGDAVKDARQ